MADITDDMGIDLSEGTLKFYPGLGYLSPAEYRAATRRITKKDLPTFTITKHK